MTHYDDCSICYNALSANTFGLTCGHAYHTNCINNWVYTHSGDSCPMCRSDLAPTDKADIITGEQLQWYSQKLLPFDLGSSLIQDAYTCTKELDFNDEDNGITTRDVYTQLLNWGEMYSQSADYIDYIKWYTILTTLTIHFGFQQVTLEQWNPEPNSV